MTVAKRIPIGYITARPAGPENDLWLRATHRAIAVVVAAIHRQAEEYPQAQFQLVA